MLVDTLQTFAKHMIALGETAKLVRKQRGLSQRAAAIQLGITHVHLNNIENNKAYPSGELCDRYREVWDVDLYILAWCLFGELTKLPPAVRRPMEKLANAWKKELKRRFPQISLDDANGKNSVHKRLGAMPRHPKG